MGRKAADNLASDDLKTTEAARVAAMKDSPDGWRLWGPYLAERAWGTVREDYSPDGSAWDYFPHDHARSRAYRWSEDGIGGISDIRQFLCFAPAFWNGNDPILKERLFGLTNGHGNHGEDVKEVYFPIDATPSHSFLRYIYRYPHAAYPYTDLLDENARRKHDPHLPEFEIDETGVFDDNRFFDIEIVYAKDSEFDLCIRLTIHNRGPEDAPISVLPTLWFRNTWSWTNDNRPELTCTAPDTIRACHERLGNYRLVGEAPDDVWFTNNDTNARRLFGSENASAFVKDSFHRRLVDSETDAVNPDRVGTKAAFVYARTIPAGDCVTLNLRLFREDAAPKHVFGRGFSDLFTRRVQEADAFYAPLAQDDETRLIQRQAFAGLIWNKQFYHYDIETWLNGDPASPPPPSERQTGRNATWESLSASDILSMPDAWEYPWFAAWDLAFHCVPFARIDPNFAKHQLLLLCREWYMHMNGQLPAYEWRFDDVNPPVHAWAALRVYKIERNALGKGRGEPGDLDFLKRIFHKLLLNFTWWVNRVDALGNNLFEGGFLGLDNIGVFDRSAPLPDGGLLEQTDGTAWMAMFALNMLAIALELARFDSAYQDVATKFAEHFLHIARALNRSDVLWDETDGFFYDALRAPDGATLPLRIRSIVGMIPLFAVEVFDASHLATVPDFRARLAWLTQHKPDLCSDVAHLADPGEHDRAIFALIGENRMRRLLARALNPDEFLSPYGIRALSRWHAANPYELTIGNETYRVAYDPGESTSGIFGGNSNWRGPIWFPLNTLLIEALQKYAFAYGDDYKIEHPAASGQMMSLWDVADDLSERLIGLFRADKDGNRPYLGGQSQQTLPDGTVPLLFHEYFHGDSGRGLGAAHQCGWTALVAHLIARRGT